MQYFGMSKFVLIAFIALYFGNAYGTNSDGKAPENRDEQSTSTDIPKETLSQKSANYIFNPKLLYSYPLNNDDSFYHFYIQDQDRLILNQSNRLQYIKFNDDKLILSDDLKLPNTETWSYISIYTCESNVPLLLQFMASRRNCFYSPDPNTLKWTNYTIDSLEKYQKVDENGVVYYELEDGSNIHEFHNDIYKEYLEVSERLAQYCGTSGDIPEAKPANDKEKAKEAEESTPTLEINIEITELLYKSAPLAEEEHFTRPKLELSSFRGEGDIRIQAYSLEVEAPVARAIFVHGYMCNFSSEFLNYNPKYLDNINNAELKEYIIHHVNVDEKRTKLKYRYGDALIRAGEMRSMISGKLKLDNNITVNLYKDGTDGWVTTDRYIYEGSPAEALNLNNISVHGLDLRSFGSSESPRIFGVDRARGLIDDFDNLAKDLITFVKIVKEKYNDGLPLYLIGLSMGGGVIVRALELHGSEDKLVDGATLIAPTMKFCGQAGIFNVIYKHARWILKTIVFLAPKLRRYKKVKTYETDSETEFRPDDMYYPNNYVYLRSEFNLLIGADDSLKNVSKINGETPLLIMQSTADDMCVFEGTEQLFNELDHVKKKNFIRFYNMNHRETISHRYFVPVCDFIVKWINDINKSYKADRKSTKA